MPKLPKKIVVMNNTLHYCTNCNRRIDAARYYQCGVKEFCSMTCLSGFYKEPGYKLNSLLVNFLGEQEKTQEEIQIMYMDSLSREDIPKPKVYPE